MTMRVIGTLIVAALCAVHVDGVKTRVGESMQAQVYRPNNLKNLMKLSKDYLPTAKKNAPRAKIDPSKVTLENVKRFIESRLDQAINHFMREKAPQESGLREVVKGKKVWIRFIDEN